jgi:hypothetical protein
MTVDAGTSMEGQMPSQQQPDFGRAETSTVKPKESDMSKEQKGNREAKKPKKEKIKTIAAAPSQKTAGWQPTFGSGKKK